MQNPSQESIQNDKVETDTPIQTSQTDVGQTTDTLTSNKDNQTIQEKQIKNKREKNQEKEETPKKQIEEKNQQSLESSNKEITLTAKQLAVMNKQLKKLEKLKKQNENLKRQSEQLKKYTINLQKKQEQLKKGFLKMQGLEETIKELQKMLNTSNKNQQEAILEANKLREIAKYEKDLNQGLKGQMEELRATASQHFLLKQEIARLSSECRTLKQANQQYPKLISQVETHENQIEKLNKQLKQKENEIANSKSICMKLEKKLDTLFEEKRSWQKQKNRLICQRQQMQGKVDALEEQMEDERSEAQLAHKKHLNEIKNLKVALHQEHQKLKLTEIQLQESRKNQKKSINLDKMKYSELGREDLYQLLEQSEMNIVSLKMALNDASEKLQMANKKVSEKNQAIFALSREITRALPDLHQSQGMDYVEKDIIEIGIKQKDDWGDIVEKVMIENLRLKSSVTALGEEYNNKMRQINKNEK